jgi:hypothetical protein
MIVLRILKYLFLGGVTQILFFVVAEMFFVAPLLWIFMPWIYVGEWLLPSGPGGHAMPGGAMLGVLVGFLTYGTLIGYGIDRLIKWYLVKRKEWF